MPVRTLNKMDKKQPKALSRLHAPEGMSAAEWQLALRQQFGPQQPFQIRNLGSDPVFSEFTVHNPQTQRTYRVAIRGQTPGANYCACADYEVNTLGTCKHVEAVLARLRRKYQRVLKLGHQPPFAEVFVQYGAQRAVRFAPGTECPPALRRLAGDFFDENGALRPEAFGRFEVFQRAAADADAELRIYDDTLALIAEVRDTAARRQLLRRKYEGTGATAAWKSLLRVPLMPYQQTGALFAACAGRALIADDMGLGKTIQAIAAAEILAREYGLERVLIICPTSLKSQWLSEIEKFSGRPAVVIEGLTHRRAALYQQPGAFFKIVNYDVVHRDTEAIRAYAPELVLLDEAQRIKNWQTRAARTVKQISSRFAIVLTGTPLENRLDELHSIVEFVDRHRLGPLFAFKAAHEIKEPEGTRVIGYQALDQINRTLAPILIRRTKQEVLSQLPERMDKNFFVPMTEPQWKYHHENREIVARLVQKWRRCKFLTEADQLRLRIALQNMRMSCDSTYLLDKQTRHGLKVDELARLLEEVFERPKQKVVIFSQWIRMNELVAEMLDARRWGHVHLHGGVPGPQRKHLVRALHEEDGCRVFLSTDAGGVGLNLQRAATVINMDLPWNPAVLEQRIGRVHRLGQKEPVRVVNFVAESTIEHGMLSLLKFKRSIFTGVLDGTADQVFLGEGALSRFMKSVESATSDIPASVPTPIVDGADTVVADQDAADAPESNGAPATTGALASAGASHVLQTAAMSAERLAGGGITPALPSSMRSAEGSEPSAPTAPAAHALGELLCRGAEFLSALAGGLTSDPSGRAAAPGLVRLDTDRATGKRELRIALPDERVLKDLAGRLLDMLASLR